LILTPLRNRLECVSNNSCKRVLEEILLASQKWSSCAL
jgi:hypothetical protein